MFCYQTILSKIASSEKCTYVFVKLTHTTVYVLTVVAHAPVAVAHAPVYHAPLAVAHAPVYHAPLVAHAPAATSYSSISVTHNVPKLAIAHAPVYHAPVYHAPLAVAHAPVYHAPVVSHASAYYR